MKRVVTWTLAWQENAWTEMGFGPRPLRRRLLPLTTPRAARGCSLGAWVLFVRLHAARILSVRGRLVKPVSAC